MSKVKVLIVFLIVSILSACSPAPEPDPNPLEGADYKSYLPFLAFVPYPECERVEKLGIAWLAAIPGEQTENDLSNFCASHYFNTSGHNFSDLHAWETPLIWCDTDRLNRDYYSVAETLGESYSGHVLIFNEPGQDVSQCVLPAVDAARAYVNFRAILPDAKFVSPNIIIQSIDDEYKSVRYLREFVLEIERLTGKKADMSAIGIHFYGAYDIRAAVKIKWVQDEMCRLGYCNIPVWVTEFGILPGVEGRFQTMSDMMFDVMSSKGVERVYAYTVRRTQNSIPWVFGSREELTDVGRGYFDGLRRAGYLR